MMDRIQVFCDYCSASVTMTPPSRRRLRRLIHSFGWIKIESLDVCPDCASKDNP